MVSPVITVTKGATVRDVARMMLEKRISAVPSRRQCRQGHPHRD
ncbi:CBS domain-containing protein [Bradyrhizobium sp. 13971]